MIDNKFRVWDKNLGGYAPVNCVFGFIIVDNGDTMELKGDKTDDHCFIIEQYLGVKDKDGKPFYIGDIGRFDNGDTFVLKMEDICLMPYVEWIGEPDCEDQARDLYRISSAVIVGNVHTDIE